MCHALTHRGGRRGGALVEFALGLPLLLAFLAGIVDYGWFYMQRVAMLHALRDATRHAVGVDPDGDPVATAQAIAAAILDDEGFPCGTGCTVAAQLVTSGGYRYLTLEVGWPYEAIIGLVPTPTLLGGHLTMLLEHQDPDAYGG